MTMRFLKPAFLLVAVSVALTWLAIEGVDVTRPIIPSDIKHEIGHAYSVPVRGMWPPEHRADSIWAPGRSSAELLENQRAQGPVHAPHDTIRIAGAGSYSDWSGGPAFDKTRACT
jgi:hypothetical protein